MGATSSFQAVNLQDPASSLAFLKRLADTTGVQPTHGVLPLAQDIARQIPEIKQRSLLVNIEAVVARISTRLYAGAPTLMKRMSMQP